MTAAIRRIHVWCELNAPEHTSFPENRRLATEPRSTLHIRKPPPTSHHELATKELADNERRVTR